MVHILPLPDDHIDDLFDLYDGYDRPPDPRMAHAEALSNLQAIRRQSGEIFVAMVDGALVGTYAIYICMNLNRSGRPFAVIENVICGAGYRRRGIGRALMEHAKGHAQEQGCYKVFLQTGATRAENHAFYEACGFQSAKLGFQARFGI